MDSRFSSSENELKSCAKTPASQFLLLPLSSPPFNFIQSTPFLSLNPNLPSLNETSIVVREVQKSIVSNIDKCFKLVVNFRSRNAVFDKIMSFSSYLQNCCQIPHRHCRSMPLLLNSNFAAILPGDSVAGIVVTSGISNFLNIYNTLLIVRLVLTWFPNAPPAIVSPLSTLCDPYLNIFRGIIPPLGGLDLSPILAFFVLNVFSSAAAALPAELPSTETSKDGKSLSTSSHLTASQKKWMRRLSGNESKHSNGEV